MNLPLKIAVDRLAARAGKPIVAQVLKDAARPVAKPAKPSCFKPG